MIPSFAQPAAEELTGRYVVTFRDNDDGEGFKLLRNHGGLRDLVHARDFEGQAVRPDDVISRDGTVFDELNICVVNCPATIAAQIAAHADASAVLSIEPEHKVYAIGTTSEQFTRPEYINTSNETWGLTATNNSSTKFKGRGISVAVLDTGIDATHPDLSAVVDLSRQQSFLRDGDTHDRNGHGTHCAGIVAGSSQPEHAPTYGVAPEVNLFIAKVLDEQGCGDVRGILGGLNWAVANRCEVVSLSLGASFESPAVMFEEAGRRALDAGTLVVAAAGNNANRDNGQFGFVMRPANSRSIMAVGAVDRKMRPASFSSRSSVVSGGEVDIVGPGVEIFSCWPGQGSYKAMSGTSMAVPFVVGTAAKCAEATGARGRDLWKLLLESALSLPHPTVDVGAGLIQAN